MESKFESLNFYEKLFTFISIKGKDPLIQFFKDIEEIKEQKIDKVISQSLFGRSSINDLYERNQLIVSFFMECETMDLETIVEKRKDLLNIIRNLDEQKLNNSIENVRLLQQLDIDKVCLSSSPSYNASMDNLVYVYKDGKSIKKDYCDVEISYGAVDIPSYDKVETLTKYRPHYGNDFGKSPSWIIITDNKWEESNERYIYLRDFSFDSKKLPTLDDLDRYYGGLKKEKGLSIIYSLPMVSGK